MPSYCLTVQYKGTDFFGWQVQPNQKTVQGELNQALKKIAKSESIYSLGSGRTDAGVHALGQVVRVDLPLEIEEMGLLRGLNSYLSSEIRILDSKKCSSHFEPVFQAKKKLYQYKFTQGEAPPAQLSDLMAWYEYDLDTKLIERGCQAFLGEHDFRNFFTVGTPVKSTVRTIYSCRLDFIPSEIFWRDAYGGYYLLSIEGSGFLKQMVRLMVGALWNLGRGKVGFDDFERALKEPRKNRLGAVAPACGLYLTKVSYS